MKRWTRPLLTTTLVAGGLGTAATAVAGAPKWATPGSTIVKCAGIAKKGQNDCGANGHSCAGHAKVNNDPNEWVYLPKGVCEKIAGGRVLKVKQVPKK